MAEYIYPQNISDGFIVSSMDDCSGPEFTLIRADRTMANQA